MVIRFEPFFQKNVNITKHLRNNIKLIYFITLINIKERHVVRLILIIFGFLDVGFGDGNRPRNTSGNHSGLTLKNWLQSAAFYKVMS